jgi:nucleoside-diphosphate-sugar epimerase
MSKKIFLAGATGAIGQVLSGLLVQNGWKVYGTSRFQEKAALLQDLGVEPVIVDVYDAEKLQNLIAEIKPDVLRCRFNGRCLGS